jgi:adenylate kinase
MARPFVVVSGLPGSGKTTLARQLAPALGLPLIDKDDILERLFESKGIGDSTWRRALSRESDAVLQHEATASRGAVLTSMWRVPGMAADSGTPTSWLSALSTLVVDVHCTCSPEIAARRFIKRKRHAGHLDGSATLAVVLDGLRAHARLGALDIGPRVNVDTSGHLRIDAVVREIRGAFTRCLTRVAADDGTGDH